MYAFVPLCLRISFYIGRHNCKLLFGCRWCVWLLFLFFWCSFCACPNRYNVSLRWVPFPIISWLCTKLCLLSTGSPGAHLLLFPCMWSALKCYRIWSFYPACTSSRCVCRLIRFTFLNRLEEDWNEKEKRRWINRNELMRLSIHTQRYVCTYVDAVFVRACVRMYILSFLIPYHQSLCALAVLDEVDVRWIFLRLREEKTWTLCLRAFSYLYHWHKIRIEQTWFDLLKGMVQLGRPIFSNISVLSTPPPRPLSLFSFFVSFVSPKSYACIPPRDTVYLSENFVILRIFSFILVLNGCDKGQAASRGWQQSGKETDAQDFFSTHRDRENDFLHSAKNSRMRHESFDSITNWISSAQFM